MSHQLQDPLKEIQYYKPIVGDLRNAIIMNPIYVLDNYVETVYYKVGVILYSDLCLFSKFSTTLSWRHRKLVLY